MEATGGRTSEKKQGGPSRTRTRRGAALGDHGALLLPTDASARGRHRRRVELQQRLATVGHGRWTRDERGVPCSSSSSDVEVLFTVLSR